MTRAERSALHRLQAAADAATPELRARIMQALERLQAGISAEEIERALLRRDALALYQLAGDLPARLLPALRALRDVMQAGMVTGMAQAGAVGIRFDAVSAAAIREARDHGAQLVTLVSEQTRAAIRQVVARSFRQGIPPREAAKLIKELVGLTPRQANSVLRRYEELVRSGLSRSAAYKQAKAYSQRLLKQRALTIARTETIRAASHGQLAAWQDLQRRGRLAPGAMKQWIVTPDDRLCNRCRRMDGQKALLASPFMGAFGAVQAPPLHPNCRCAVTLTFTQVSRRAA